jgi:hypothetical protein
MTGFEMRTRSNAVAGFRPTPGRLLLDFVGSKTAFPFIDLFMLLQIYSCNF